MYVLADARYATVYNFFVLFFEKGVKTLDFYTSMGYNISTKIKTAGKTAEVFMRKTKLGEKLYERALDKVTTSVNYAISINCWHVAREANCEARGIAYALWGAGQINDTELNKVVTQYWENHELIERHFAELKE